jgi:DNA polymerase-3 subunit gamma/tau
MYQALYRKWRPRTFDDVTGQKHITTTLKRQVESGRLSHAYLFVGTRGTGKTSCAKILARAVNCETPAGGNPCNACPSCLGILDGSILDVLELDAASNNGVDNVRALRDEAVYSPVDVKKRVYIVDEVHMLSTSAFNALLKILEEPPAHLMFILATTEIHKVPATIVSRCQRFTFKRLAREDIAAHLLDIARREGLPLTEDAAVLLSRLGDGSMRDALSLLDQCTGHEQIDTEAVLSSLGLAGTEDITALFQAVLAGDVAKSLEILNGLYTNGKIISSLLEELSALVRDTLLIILMPQGASGLLSGAYDGAVLKHFAGKVSPQRLQLMLETLRDANRAIALGSNARVSAELCLMRLARPELLTGDVSALTARIAELEKRLEGAAVHRTASPQKKASPAREGSGALDTAPARAKTARSKKAPIPIEKDDVPPFDMGDAPPARDDAPPFDMDEIPPFDLDDAPPIDTGNAPPFDVDDTPPFKPDDMPPAADDMPPAADDVPPAADDVPPFDVDDAPPFDGIAAPTPAAKDGTPAPSKAPDAAPAKPAQGGNATWEAVLRLAEAEIDIPSFVLISDSAHVTASFEGSTLCLNANNPFAEQLLNQSEIRQTLSRAAEKVTGHGVTLRVTSGQPKQAPDEDKLDRLSRFSIFTFE